MTSADRITDKRIAYAYPLIFRGHHRRSTDCFAKKSSDLTMEILQYETDGAERDGVWDDGLRAGEVTVEFNSSLIQVTLGEP